VQRRGGNKLITAIRGLEAFRIDLEGVVRDFKKRFACSVTIAPVKGIEKESEILVQGTADVRDILCKSYGIPSQYITTK
jgi:translation initiation factor 1 (eIF-1/SUI1)